ncbi:MAG: hypothetical protein R3B48_01040 [Kofleriaceae bacterium]
MSAARRDDVRALGRALGALGLHPRALEAWLGTATLARLPARLAEARPNPSPAAWALELFVAGRGASVEVARRRLGAHVDTLVALGLAEVRGDALLARRAIVPIGRAGAARTALAVCDRWDAPAARDGTPWPDDSSHHLCGALDGARPARWLDLGVGSALAPLTCAPSATLVVGADVVLASARCAALGAALSGHDRLRVLAADLDDAIAGRWDLLTCNAPIPARADPAPPEASRWRHADADFLQRLCALVPARVADDGLAVLHAPYEPLRDALAEHRGDAVSVIYTPSTVPPFAVTWWQPHLPYRRRATRRALTAERPHVDGRDRADAANNRAAPLPEDLRS